VVADVIKTDGAGDLPIVVIVDDDPVILGALARCLKREAVEVRTTTMAAEALRWIVLDPVAVLVSDYDMPVMTGAELAAKARAARPETIRILLTGKQTLETAVEGINRGEIFRFVTKPFSAEGLRGDVLAALERHHELVALTDDRRKRERHQALRRALEAEYPGITEVPLAGDGAYEVTETPEQEASELGFEPLALARTRTPR
jgi:DNA-binding NtrC family response regulator